MDFIQVVSTENMRQSDAHTIEHHTSSAELMRRAAQGIFDAAQFTGKVAIVCGKGNNGGDGYALACILCSKGLTPTIFRATDGFSPDGLYYYNTALSLGAEEGSLSVPSPFAGYDIVVDCLLGTGFSGTPHGGIREAIELINGCSSFVISADINSGINGDTGVAEIAVSSDLTVSIGAYKTGMFLNAAPYYIDKLMNADIGIHLLKEEYRLVGYSALHMFEGYGSKVMATAEFFAETGLDPKTCDMPKVLSEMSTQEKKIYVVKTDHSAVIADLHYIYFCADYVG